MADRAWTVSASSRSTRSRRTGCTASRPRATRSARRSSSPTRSSCARTTCTRWRFPPSVKAIGRAGAGTNNIPVAEMSKRGVPVFNAPGANANAVKELVLAALLLAARNVIPALALRRRRSTPRRADLEARVEDGKKQFAGVELPQPHAGHRRPGRDRQPGRRHRDQARHEGHRLRPGDHRRRRVAPAVERAQARTAIEEVLKHVRLRHAARAAAAGDAPPDRRQAARRR